jgi:hypothetical protein
LNSLYFSFWILHQSCVFPFFWQPFFLFVGHTLKKICVATSRVLTIKILGNFRPTLTFFLRTNHVCFLIRYDTLVLMFLCTILKRSVFSSGKLFGQRFLFFFASFFIILQNENRYFSNFSQIGYNLFSLFSLFFEIVNFETVK